MTQQEIIESNTDVAIYVISRNSGEGKDRYASQGDYYLSDSEKEQLKSISLNFDKMIVILNCGGPIDLSYIDELNICAVVSLSQPGMEGGNALADVIRGAITPSGKMSDTWAYNYEDFPNSANFSHNNGNTEEEVYEEGVYVGYRYFDTFSVKPRIPFGFGLSYTDFSIKPVKTFLIHSEEHEIKVAVQAEVTNTGIHMLAKKSCKFMYPVHRVC